MSLRARLLILLVLMNLLVLGIIQVTAARITRQFFARETQTHLVLLQRNSGFLLPEGVELEGSRPAYRDAVRGIFERGSFDLMFRDMVIKGRNVAAKVDLNPLGCAHRDFATFDSEAVLAGIDEAMETETLVSAAGGRCVAIKSDGGRVEGGAWFVPAFPEEPRLTFVDFAVPVVICMMLFAVLANWIVGRTVGRPMDQLGRAARRVEDGDYSARVPSISVPELYSLVEAFNAMATKVEGHTEELGRKVEIATREAAAKERAMLAASRLAAMGTLAAGVAHEINNPIGGMLNAVNSLSQKADRSAKETRYLELIRQGLERVARTSRKLLDFTPRSFEPVEFSLVEAVERARALIEHRIEAQGVTFETRFAADLPALWGEPNDVQQVMLNLVLNSLNAMRGLPGRHIRIGARVLEDTVEVTVADDGPGVEEEILQQVMNPFFSTSNSPDSTGLGLFISYTIMQNHGASMAVESQPGQGFLVRLGFPLRTG